MNKHTQILIRNFFLYLALIAGLLLLWSPMNRTARNQPGSTIQFVYQQF